MARILFVRHGETEWNKERRVMGHLHIPLNINGVKQVKSMAESLKTFPISAIYASPLKRTMQTAQIIANHHNLSVIEMNNIIEIDFGEWNGKYFEDIKDDPKYKRFHKTPKNTEVPGGEKIADVQSRSVAAVEQVYNAHKKDTVVMVSHCDIIRIILAYYMRMDINDYRRFIIDNASLSIIEFSADKITFPVINYLPDIGGRI